VLDPGKRFITVVLALGIVVLIAAIAIGERAGNRVIGRATEQQLRSIAPPTLSPKPETGRNTGPYGPNWKSTDVMAVATDPAFPDPRVPPVPLPTVPPPPKSTPAPRSTFVPSPSPTPNLNIPVWRRAAPLPTPSPAASFTPYPGPSNSPSPSSRPSLQPRGL
jgi:hypothetical protein